MPIGIYSKIKISLSICIAMVAVLSVRDYRHGDKSRLDGNTLGKNRSYKINFLVKYYLLIILKIIFG